MKETKTIMLKSEIEIGDMVHAITRNKYDDILEIIKQIDLKVADCDFTGICYLYFKKSIDEDCNDVE